MARCWQRRCACRRSLDGAPLRFQACARSRAALATPMDTLC